MTEENSMFGRGQGVIEPTTDKRMFSLMEVAQETGIAMPILLRYKREHPDRIPSVGSGAQQRFPEEAFAIFAQIREEESQDRDLPRRGGFGLLSLPRIRKSKNQAKEEVEPSAARDEPAATQEAAKATEPSVAPSPAAGGEAPATGRAEQPAGKDEPPTPAPRAEDAATETRPSVNGEATLTLKDISERLGIAYPTVARYAAKFPERIPHEGEGRQRRFPHEAIAVFEQIRKESKPGRPPKSKSAKAAKAKARPARSTAASPVAPVPQLDERKLLQRIERLEEEHQQLEDLVRTLREELRRPLKATISPD